MAFENSNDESEKLDAFDGLIRIEGFEHQFGFGVLFVDSPAAAR